MKVSVELDISDRYLAEIIEQRADKEPDNSIKEVLSKACLELNPDKLKNCFTCNSPRIETLDRRVYRDKNRPVDLVWLIRCRDCNKSTEYFTNQLQAVLAWNEMN